MSGHSEAFRKKKMFHHPNPTTHPSQNLSLPFKCPVTAPGQLPSDWLLGLPSAVRPIHPTPAVRNSTQEQRSDHGTPLPQIPAWPSHSERLCAQSPACTFPTHLLGLPTPRQPHLRPLDDGIPGSQPLFAGHTVCSARSPPCPSSGTPSPLRPLPSVETTVLLKAQLKCQLPFEFLPDFLADSALHSH